MDLNEDDFTEDNVTAICKIGKSTKSAQTSSSQSFIGEKGIGLKSVFKVAKRVYVKSEPYSFSFSCDPQSRAGGLGMITPIGEAYEDMPLRGTCFVLGDIGSTSFKELCKEFKKIPDTLLLFLQSLELLVVKICRGNQIKETRFSRTNARMPCYQDINITTVEHSARDLTEVPKATAVIRTLKFYVTEQRIDNLPLDEARKTAEGGYITSAKVVLAFPVSESREPWIEDQFVYAFLPLRKVHFPVSLGYCPRAYD